MYNISKYSYQQAKRLGVEIYPSDKKNKKIDVYKNGKYIVSIGDDRYNDYPYYLSKYGKEYANYRRDLYWIRHNKDIYNYGSAGYYAARILW
jgi:hypothetical protein